MSMTAEQLQAVPVDGTIACRERRWRRTGPDTWTNQLGVTLPTRAFLDDLDNVEEREPYRRPTLGRAYRRRNNDSGWWYVPVKYGNESDESEQIEFVMVSDDATPNVYSNGIAATGYLTGRDWITSPDREDVPGNIHTLGQMMYHQVLLTRQLEEMRQQTREQSDTGRSAVDAYKESARDYLKDYVVDNGLDGQSDTAELFENLELDPLTDEIEVTVTVSGHSNVSLDAYEGQQWTPEGADCEGVDDFEVDWTMDVTVTKDGSPGECVCSDVEYDDVSTALNNLGVEYLRFNYTCDCPNG